jgi:hypothetical protein
MTRFRTRLARLEGPTRRRLVIFVIDRLEEDGPVVGSAMVDRVVHPRNDGESEEGFRNRIEQTLRPISNPRANAKAR